MNDSPLKVGEIGVVVYCSFPNYQEVVGSIVEIMAVDVYREDPKEYYSGKVPGYPSPSVSGCWTFYKDQIRRIQDSDKSQQKVRECVVS